MIKLLSIAGSDPSGGAGIQVDLKTFQALGAFGMAIPAALTFQNSRGVAGTEPVPPASITRQIEVLLSDMRPDAIKTGMLLTRQAVAAVAKSVKKHGISNVVVDPIVRSTSGRILLRPDGIKALKEQLLPLALLVTPNIPEAEVLTGVLIRNDEDMDFAAGKLLDLGPKYVLIKGGHRPGPAVDTLYGGKQVLEFSTERQKGDFHGTGCVLSAAITLFIGQGLPVEKAVEKGKQFVEKMLKKARPAGKGRTKYFQF
ncbi:MAG: bifunctional hydroxymethylpyrimidine kinase/phosphomethylpyrimidine kinase [Nitrospirota bacterium]|nr:bifunctional hydroxymethylpyrimidine kinase/phosphomethylpyrimidine kinase [Nitrospirota bacterium]